MRGLFESGFGEVQLFGIRNRGQQKTDRRGLVPFEHQIAQGKEVAEALRHLLTFDQQKAHVHPETGKWLSCERFRLGDFIFVVREGQVFAARVEIEGVAQVLHGHHRALDMPSRTPLSDRCLPEGEAFWETPIGKGRPGWHIECSVMAMKYLGNTLDLHAGGEDLTFPHHENEIAQSESLTGKPFSRFWMHVRFLLVEGKKMSKSLGNFFTLRDLVLEGYKPSAIRFLLASVPYTKQLNFTKAGLEQAAHSVQRLRDFKARLTISQLPPGAGKEIRDLAARTRGQMTAGLEDDLNTAQP